MNYSGIIFDLDGTLVDSLEDLSQAMSFGLRSLGLPTHSPDEYRLMVGEGVSKFAERALGLQHTEKVESLLEIMTAYYYTHCLENTQPYEGMRKVVQILHSKGVKLAVLTNKNARPSVKIVEALFGTDLFAPIIGMEPHRRRKPDPASVYEILNIWSLAAGDVLFVGDSDIDIQTARAAGLKAAGAAWGYRSIETLQHAGAQVILNQPEDLLAF